MQVDQLICLNHVWECFALPTELYEGRECLETAVFQLLQQPTTARPMNMRDLVAKVASIYRTSRVCVWLKMWSVVIYLNRNYRYPVYMDLWGVHRVDRCKLTPAIVIYGVYLKCLYNPSMTKEEAAATRDLRLKELHNLVYSR